MTKPKRKPHLTSEPHDMRIADRKYQPSKAEHETETDMPRPVVKVGTRSVHAALPVYPRPRLKQRNCDYWI